MYFAFCIYTHNLQCPERFDTFECSDLICIIGKRNGFYIDTVKKSLSITLGVFANGLGNGIHFQVPVEAIISIIPHQSWMSYIHMGLRFFLYRSTLMRIDSMAFPNGQCIYKYFFSLFDMSSPV